MDVEAVLKELRDARDTVDATIAAVERIAAGSKHASGSLLAALKTLDGPKRRGKRQWSPKKNKGERKEE